VGVISPRLCGGLLTTIGLSSRLGLLSLLIQRVFRRGRYHTKMYGHDPQMNVIHTPNLDALSAAGCRLENYYVQPVCSPTRSTIM
jgi:hypothetical protein